MEIDIGYLIISSFSRNAIGDTPYPSISDGTCFREIVSEDDDVMIEK
jgi:hypothetical protein